MRQLFLRTPVLTVTVLLGSFFIACSGTGGNGGGGADTTDRTTLLANATSWVYQLQNLDPDDIGESFFDIAVIDYASDGSDDTAFSAAEVTTMQGSGTAAKLVIAYMSIGEAEDYRFYFENDADYLDAENPDWPGNYKVRYWEGAWQTVIDSYLDRLIDAGFDGAYLDIIDAYEYYGPGGDSGVERATAADDMVDFVIHIADYARARDPNFLIFPQNGAGILEDSSKGAEYLDAVDGIGAEDTFYFGDENEDNELDEQSSVITALDEFVANGKTVLAVDYLTDADKIADFYARAAARSYLPYATVRDLDALTVNAGHAPE